MFTRPVVARTPSAGPIALVVRASLRAGRSACTAAVVERAVVSRTIVAGCAALRALARVEWTLLARPFIARTASAGPIALVVRASLWPRRPVSTAAVLEGVLFPRTIAARC